MDNQSKLNEKIKETMINAFWDKINNDLNKTPPDHKHLMILLDEIKCMLKNLIPNRKDLHNEIDEQIDVKFIEQMIVNNAFDYNELKNLINYVVKMIQKLQCPAEDKDTNEWLKIMNNMCKEKEKWNIIILFFLKKAYSKIEGIKIGVEEFKMKIKKSNE